MKVTITKAEHRNRLTCIRDDGTTTSSDTGPTLPLHDLAHYVVERKLRLANGFYGNIAKGYAITQLGEKEIILKLGAEALTAEILARATQSLHSGSSRPEQFAELVNAELAQWSIPALDIPRQTIDAIQAELRALAARYDELKNGESLELRFDARPALSAAKLA